MSRLWKATKVILLSVVVLLVVVLCAVIGYRAYVQHANAKAIAIHLPNGIDEGMYVAHDDHQSFSFLFRLCQPRNNCSKFIEYLVPAL
jgi:hypothetical protein